MRRMIATALLVTATANTSYALSGAELLQADRTFAYGYVLGVVDMRIGLKYDVDVQFDKVRKCVIDSKANNATLYNVVSNYLASHPQDLTVPAFGAIINALADMCVKN